MMGGNGTNGTTGKREDAPQCRMPTSNLQGWLKMYSLRVTCLQLNILKHAEINLFINQKQ
jgi:hypothetical protein